MAYLLAPDLYDPPEEAVDEWLLLKAARWAGVPPWELARQPAYWMNAICDAMEVDGRLKKASLREERSAPGESDDQVF